MTSSMTLSELEAKYSAPGSVVPTRLLRRLRTDPRKGARQLYARLRRRRAKELREKKHAAEMFRFERRLWAEGIGRVAGVDEVGIGPMAGPVVAAAVVFEAGTGVEGVDDSKKLEPLVREDLNVRIRANARAVGVGVVETPDVDRLNVYHAGLLAMRRAVRALSLRPEHVLVDARTIPELEIPQTGVKHGDCRSVSIAAASVVAKVYRDRLMVALDRVHPGYGFARHKGYCSPEHQAAVRRLGPSPVHRRSFDFIRELTGEYDPIFYELREAVSCAETAEDLAEWDGRLRAARHRLSPTGFRKLRGLALRRSRQAARA